MEQAFFEKNKNKYVYIFADCQLVKGFSRTTICDLSRKRIFFISNSYYKLTTYFRKHTVGGIIEMLDGKNSRLQFYKFLNFLSEEHIAILADDINSFPEVAVCWDSPSSIINAIIDIRDKYDFLDKAFNELYILRCQYLQLRFYKETDARTIQHIVSLLKGKCFKDVEILLKFNPGETSHEFLLQLSAKQKNVRFLIHSAPQGSGNLSGMNVQYTEQAITSLGNCNNISSYMLHIPSLQGFMENKLFNSCLNRKISIDENGYIKNCPSMRKHYGHINDTSLMSVVKRHDFKKIWKLNKDAIDTCKDCEFRYICTDCRASKHGDNLTGKPLSCKYDPYEGVRKQ